jgi:DNA processing protein
VADGSGGDREELAAYLALAEIPGIGSARLRTLIAAFDSARGAMGAPHGAIAGLPGFGRAAATAVRAASLGRGIQVLDQLDALNASLLLPTDPRFPARLDEIPEPPALLYVTGNADLLHQPAVAMVGSRDHTAYGAEAGRLLAGAVARAAVVVSGMARGLDAIVHQAALDAPGPSIGVLGNGFGVIYPAANRALYERMAREGCLITELPPGERPHAGAFPRRNRLISGLAVATVVIEAAPGSGALITADCALEQGRSVLAVPGPITSLTSLGCNRLIQQGAKPALSPGDILEELGLSMPDRFGYPVPLPTPGHRPGVSAPVPPPDLTPLQRTLWDALAPGAKHVDALAEGASVGTGDVLTALTELELRGVVKQGVGMVFEVSL